MSPMTQRIAPCYRKAMHDVTRGASGICCNMTGSRDSNRGFGGELWLAIAIAALVLIPRGYFIANAQSERIDDEYHLQRGIQFLNQMLAGDRSLPLNDPPLGAAISLLPLWIAGCWAPQTE